jgi:hypothetical protein
VDEAENAKTLNKLVPVKIDSTPPPMGFGSIHFSDLSQWNGNIHDPIFLTLLKAIYSLAPPPGQAQQSDPPDRAESPAKSGNRYRLIIEDFKGGSMVPFLGPGINSSYYIDLALKLAEYVQNKLLEGDGDPSEKHQRLIHALVGIPCSVCHYWPQDRPPECPMLKTMQGNSDIRNCPLYVEQGLAVSKINLRYLAQYYILRNGRSSLYTDLEEIQCELQQSHNPSPVQNFIAKLPELMRQRKYPKRWPGLPYQLVVTTAVDDMLEKAFRAVQQPFDLVFYEADGEQKGKFMHQPYQRESKGPATVIGANESERLPLRPPWGNAPEPRPILLKLFGTWERCFVTTEEDVATLMSMIRISLPTGLKSIITNGNILFMGYSPGDADWQHLINCFWDNNEIKEKSWLLHQAAPGDLEEAIWEARNVDLLQTSSLDEFAAQVDFALQSLPIPLP